MSRHPTIKDVAREAGVAISTVSYALSGKRSISDDTRAKVLSAARRLGYRRSVAHRHDERGGVFAVSSPVRGYTDYTNYFAFLLPLVLRARSYNYDTLLLVENAQDDRDLRRIAARDSIEGTFLLDVMLNDPRAINPPLDDVPTIAIGYPENSEDIRCVDLDFELMGRQAVRRARDLGHREILMVGSHSQAYRTGANYLIRLRRGVRREAALCGMIVHYAVADSDDFSTINAMMRQEFAAHPRITALFDTSNYMAIMNVLQSLTGMHKRIPDDVSILALGNFGNGSILPFPIDEMPMRPTEVCSRAVDMMMSVLRGGVELLAVCPC